MDLFSPLRLGLHVATDAVKLATIVPRLIVHQLKGDDDEQRFAPASDQQQDEQPVRPPRSGGRDARPSSSGATPRRATRRRPGVQSSSSPAEPTSAAGASGGIAGTAAAPGDAAIVGSPDPTAASSATRARRTVPQGERSANDVRPQRTTPVRQRTEPKRSEIDRRRAEERQAVETPETTLAETEGSASPGATLRIDEPWDGYGSMKAGDISARLQSSDAATKAVVRLYEQTHKKRKSILDATAS